MKALKMAVAVFVGLHKSKTTRNVAIGGVTMITAANWIVARLLEVWPELPVLADHPVAIANAIGGVLGLLAGRYLAFMLDESKAVRNGAQFLVVAGLLSVLVTAGAGCATGQGWGNRTLYEVDFENVQAGELMPDGTPTEGESIIYHCKVKGQPGDILAVIASMGIKVDGADKWSIDLAQEGQMDTTAQAAMLTTITQTQTDFAGAVVEGAIRGAVEALGIKASVITHGMDVGGAIVGEVIDAVGGTPTQPGG